MGKGHLFEFAAPRDMSIAIKAGATRFGLFHSPVYWSTYPGGYCLAVGVSLRSGDKRRREVLLFGTIAPAVIASACLGECYLMCWWISSSRIMFYF